MKILFILLSFIFGIFFFYILKEICKCSYIEGYGLFGRVNLQKCCPKGYMFSDTIKECVAVCDGCGMAAYGKLKLENIGEKRGEFELAAHYECNEHDAATIYDYDKINRRYTKKQDQYDFYSDLFDDSASGVQAAEEGDNEAWSSIDTEIKNFTREDFDGDVSDTNIVSDNRKSFCTNASGSDDYNASNSIGNYNYNDLCGLKTSISVNNTNWNSLCGNSNKNTALCSFSNNKKICNGTNQNIFCN
jgi:hypothetical protein